MSQNVCTSCGAPLTRGQKFCTRCGGAIDARTSEREAIPSLAATSSEASDGTIPLPPQSEAVTVPMPPVTTSATSTAANRVDSVPASIPPSISPSASSSKKGVVIVLLCTLVGVVVLIAVLFAVGIFSLPEPAPNEPDNALQEQPVNQEPPRSDEVESAEDIPKESVEASTSNIDTKTDTPTDTEPSSPEPDRAEVAVYDKLIVLYDDLASFDQRIAEAAQSFNANYLSPSYETRAAYASEAESLLSDIYDSYNDLYNTTVSAQSPNASAYKALDTCYEDCIQRISVISEAWNTSLLYDDPSLYQDEILEPIARDNVNGANRYYTEFQETYPLAQPVEP